MDTVQAAKLASIPTAFMLAGYYTCSSQNPLPILLDQRAGVSTPIFARIYARGTAAVAPATMLATSAFGYLAYITKDATKQKYYGSGAVLAFSVLPWTALVMLGGIKRLIKISEDKELQLKADQTLEVRQKLNAWIVQNWVRAGLTFAAGMVGLVAAL